MRVLSITELMRMARAELCGLLVHIIIELLSFVPNSPEYANVHVNLQNIRAAISWKNLCAALKPSLRFGR
jgi:hypothetical protein